jgi:hypothetical protein
MTFQTSRARQGHSLLPYVESRSASYPVRNEYLSERLTPYPLPSRTLQEGENPIDVARQLLRETAKTDFSRRIEYPNLWTA